MPLPRERLPGGPVEAPADVLAGLEAVRRSGRTNILDREAVAQIAASLGFHAAAEWVRLNPGRFAESVFREFRVPESPER